ncbi:unnamed protein product, partial [Brassica rapa subsp. trilocularis]
MAYLKVEQNIKKGAAKTKMVWTLGAASRSVEMIEKLLEAGMNIARFDFSEGLTHTTKKQSIISEPPYGTLVSSAPSCSTQRSILLSLSLLCV